MEEFKIDNKKPTIMIYQKISDAINQINQTLKELQEEIEKIKKKGEIE